MACKVGAFMNSLNNLAKNPEPNATTLQCESLDTAARLMAVGDAFYQRNWVLGTSGNLSVVLSNDPFELMITASGVHKGTMKADDFVIVGRNSEIIRGSQRPSAETLIHLSIISACGAGSVVHSHSVWGTILSDAYAASGGLAIRGYEMLKGLSHVATHQHEEWLPILENSQDYPSLSQTLTKMFLDKPGIHGFLLHRHGLYTWGRDLEEAKRHAEIFEFLFEVVGRQCCNIPKANC
jgi:methylthioribulose-1-phosphate dehydratase